MVVKKLQLPFFYANIEVINSQTMDFNQKLNLALTLFFLMISTIFLIIAIRSWSETNTIYQKGIQTQGMVLENVLRPRRGSEPQSTAMAPVVLFNTTDGQQYKYYSTTYTTPAMYDPGDIVDIWYLPEDPQKATLSGKDAMIFPLVFGIFGGVAGLIGIGMLFSWIRSFFFS